MECFEEYLDNEKNYACEYVKFCQRRDFLHDDIITLEFYYSSNNALQVHEVNNAEVTPEVYEIVRNICEKYKYSVMRDETLQLITEEIKDSLSNLPDITLM